MRSKQVDAIEAFLALPDWEEVSGIRRVVTQAHLQTVFNVVQRTIDSDIEVLLCGPCKAFEPGSWEP